MALTLIRPTTYQVYDAALPLHIIFANVPRRRGILAIEFVQCSAPG
ncbi:hypothetical protein CKO_00267 [Citrobacter koseri ATCC BAA-895]|uniref:Uncharacterized protein n=1 Tax=Citrobacter koseri (strain ATCC BAA-895 / CDC 4225-83 / SGSC4696) TaxID=290338 RepID=A8AD68_CITK8|nr:hypothetical protein CKO_00267 [Citrobacter koseri ATCC BAA-895]